MIKHLAWIIGITLLIVLCIVRPFLPGDYDGLAMPLSTMAQAFGVVGMLLVPVGGLWLVYEFRSRARKKNLPVKARGYAFALVSLVVATLVAAIISLIGLVTLGPSLGLLTLTLWLYAFSKLIPKLKSLKNAEREPFNPTPLYLIILPIAALLSQILLAAPMTEFSRTRAIAMSAEFIGDIEAYRTANGHYPVSLLATWKDYYPDIVGIEKFHYAPEGEAYNLFFEQPRFLLDNIGTREFVVYNPLDEQRIISHTSWILLLTPEELDGAQGWYEVHEASSPHWKYFWFD
ncbi:MAG: hypothetical protein Fur0022_03600 [Anaerolineales bacterium]